MSTGDPPGGDMTVQTQGNSSLPKPLGSVDPEGELIRSIGYETIVELNQRIVKCDNGDKLIGLLNGSLIDQYTSEKKARKAIEEVAMFFACGQIDVARKLVRFSPLADEDESDAEIEERMIATWENLGASTYDRPNTWTN